MIENLYIFDFELDQEDMKRIKTLDTGKSLCYSQRDPETIKGFCSIKLNI